MALALIAALSFIGSLAGAYLAARMRKSGELDAIGSRLDEVIAQAKATTEATEEIKSKIAQGDWTTREIITLRRAKLEELLRLIFEADDYIGQCMYAAMAIDPVDPPIQRSMDIAKVLCALYFRELGGPVTQFSVTYHRLEASIAAIKAASVERQRVLKVATLKQEPPPDTVAARINDAVFSAAEKTKEMWVKELKPLTLMIQGKAGKLINEILGKEIGRNDTDWEKLFRLANAVRENAKNGTAKGSDSVGGDSSARI